MVQQLEKWIELNSAENYKEHMLVFAIEQIALDHIDTNLAIIYEDLLFVEMIVPYVQDMWLKQKKS